jgi:hypothetical protein
MHDLHCAHDPVGVHRIIVPSIIAHHVISIASESTIYTRLLSMHGVPALILFSTLIIQIAAVIVLFK